MDEPVLPGMPEPSPAAPRPLPAGVRFSRYAPKNRVLCDSCIDLIHTLGQAVAPFPRSARWKAVDATGVRHLCEVHKEAVS